MEAALVVMAIAVGTLGTLVVLMLRKTFRLEQRDVSLNVILPEEFRFTHKTITEEKKITLDKGLSSVDNMTGDYRGEWEALLNKLNEDSIKQAFMDDDEAYFKVHNRMRPISKEMLVEMKTLCDFTVKRA